MTEFNVVIKFIRLKAQTNITISNIRFGSYFTLKRHAELVSASITPDSRESVYKTLK